MMVISCCHYDDGNVCAGGDEYEYDPDIIRISVINYFTNVIPENIFEEI